MDLRPLRARLSLLGQGLTIGRSFGPRAVTGLLRTAELVQKNLVDPDSLRVGTAGLEFELWNPPLRPGAFFALSARLDGRAVPAERSFIGPAEGPTERSFAGITRESPIGLASGVAQRVRLAPERSVPPGPHTVRLELRNVAIPLVSWLEFTGRFRGRR